VQYFGLKDADQPALLAQMQDAVDAVDQQMSPWKPDSVLNQINRASVGEWIDLPRQTYEVIKAALQIETQSQGAFAITVAPTVNYWGFGAKPAAKGKVPGAQPLAAQCLILDEERSTLRKTAAVEIDLCGIAKGYGVDELAKVMQSHGVADYLASIDGEIRCAGRMPDGHGWQVGLEQPCADQRKLDSVLECLDLSLATSGGYRHFHDGPNAPVTHTIDPATGQPLSHVLASVTVAAEDCHVADAWATALMVLGATKGVEMAEEQGLDAMFMWAETGGVSHRATGSMSALI
jgi:thiamine biosynthesis lipoprotein